jgi:hypothetical protein
MRIVFQPGFVSQFGKKMVLGSGLNKERQNKRPDDKAVSQLASLKPKEDFECPLKRKAEQQINNLCTRKKGADKRNNINFCLD